MSERLKSIKFWKDDTTNASEEVAKYQAKETIGILDTSVLG